MEESTASNITNDVSKTKESSTFSSNFSIRTLSCEEIESRKNSYLKFITSLPKICSPTICGTLNYQTPKSNSKFLTSTTSNLTKSESLNSNNQKTEDTSGYCSYKEILKISANQSCKGNCKEVCLKICKEICLENCNDVCIEKCKEISIQKCKEVCEESCKEEINDNNDINFDWSIEQIALLNPCDITLDDNFLIYKGFEELNKSVLLKEGEEYFKQNVIAPSPIVNTPVVARKRQLMENLFKTSSPFLDYLKKQKKFKTPILLNEKDIKTPESNHPLSTNKDRENLPKKKLFHLFDSPCSNLSKTMDFSVIEDSCIKNLSKIPLIDDSFNSNSFIDHLKLNCTDLEKNKLSLDISIIEKKEPAIKKPITFNSTNLITSPIFINSDDEDDDLKINNLKEDKLNNEPQETSLMDFSICNNDCEDKGKDDLLKTADNPKLEESLSLMETSILCDLNQINFKKLDLKKDNNCQSYKNLTSTPSRF